MNSWREAFSLPRSREIILFVCIVCLGVALRYTHFFDWMPWEEDAGRDILVAKHVLEYGEPWRYAPPASGTPYILNTALYYWIITAAYFFTKSVVGVEIFFAVLGIGTIIAAYCLGKLLKSTFVALALAATISVSYFMVVSSQSILQPNLIPLIIMCSLISIVLFHNTHTVLSGMASITLMFIGVAIHLSYVPAFVALTCVLLWELATSPQKQSVRIIFLAYYGLLFVWVTRFFSIENVSLSRGSLSAFSYGSVLIPGVEHILSFAFYGIPPWGIHMLLIVIPALLTYGFAHRRLIHHQLKQLYVLSILWLMLIVPISLLYGANAPYYYYFALYVPLYMAIIIAVQTLPRRDTRLVAIGLFLLSVSLASFVKFRSNPTYQFEAVRGAALSIYKDYRSHDITEPDGLPNMWPIAATGQMPGVFGMMSEQYWFLLEEYTGKQLVTLVEGPRNTAPIVKEPHYLYIVCYEGLSVYSTDTECLSDMESHYPLDFVKYGPNPIIVAEVYSPVVPLRIFRFEKIR